MSANGLQINGQQFKKNGNKSEGEFVVNAMTAGDQSNASIAIDVLGRAVVVWSGNGAGDTGGVYLQRYSTDLHPLETLEHDHGHEEAANDAEVVDIDPYFAGIDAQNAAGHSHRHDVNPGSGAGTEVRHERLESWLRIHNPDHQSSTTESEHSASSGRRHAGLAELAELPGAIDSLFGSDAWLSGRHYRGVNGRA